MAVGARARRFRDHVDEVARRLATRGGDYSQELAALNQKAKERLDLLQVVENLKRDQNAASEQVARAKKEGRDASALLAESIRHFRDLQDAHLECSASCLQAQVQWACGEPRVAVRTVEVLSAALATRGISLEGARIAVLAISESIRMCAARAATRPACALPASVNGEESSPKILPTFISLSP